MCAPAANTTAPACAPRHARHPGRITAELPALADLGYEGETDPLTVAVKKPSGGALTDDQHAYNGLHAALRAIGERANTLLETTFKAMQRVGLDPGMITAIVGGALVLLHSRAPAGGRAHGGSRRRCARSVRASWRWPFGRGDRKGPLAW